MQVKCKKLHPGARTPVYATAHAAGADLYACLPEPVVLKPGERTRIPTGIALEMTAPGYVALVFARSGLAARQGLALTNGVGVVDEDYRGEIQILVINLGQEDIIIEDGERIAQMALVPVKRAVFAETEELTGTERGTGGFGSTGVGVYGGTGL